MHILWKLLHRWFMYIGKGYGDDPFHPSVLPFDRNVWDAMLDISADYQLYIVWKEWRRRGRPCDWRTFALWYVPGAVDVKIGWGDYV